MQSIQQVMSRISAIESSIAPTAAKPTTTTGSGLAGTSFDQVMSRALGTGGVLGSRHRTLGDYAGFGGTTPLPSTQGYATNGSTGAPAGLEAYANGQIPDHALTPIPGTTERMWAPAAHAFMRMREAAARDGVTLPVVDAYRPYEDQVRLAGELGLYSEGGLAAYPGTSQHGWGRAIDIETSDENVAWLRANAGSFGFVETVPREPWHWEFHG